MLFANKPVIEPISLYADELLREAMTAQGVSRTFWVYNMEDTDNFL